MRCPRPRVDCPPRSAPVCGGWAAAPSHWTAPFAGPSAAAISLEMARGVEQGAGEPAQAQSRQFLSGEPGDVAEFAVAGRGGTIDDPRFVDGGDIGDAVSVRVA